MNQPPTVDTLDENVDTWRQRQDAGDLDPWTLAVWATSDISEESDFTSWCQDRGAAIQRVATTGDSRWYTTEPGDIDRLRSILRALDGRWVEYPEWADKGGSREERRFDVLPPLPEWQP